MAEGLAQSGAQAEASIISNLIVIARLVRATQDLRVAKKAAAIPKTCLRHRVFMGRPDKPGDDDP
jgi:hypothetical protein